MLRELSESQRETDRRMDKLDELFHVSGAS